MACAAKYYSPRLDRALITLLYHAAKAQRVPMTTLTNRLVADGLPRLEEAGDERQRATVAEEPPGRDPAPAK